MTQPVVIDTDISIDFGLDKENAFESMSMLEKDYELMKKFRFSHGVDINDMLIAATAIETKTKMISKNQKHYQFIPGLDLLQDHLGEE